MSLLQFLFLNLCSIMFGKHGGVFFLYMTYMYFIYFFIYFRLTGQENLFTNHNRVLEPWTVYNDKDSACSRPNSITRTKCKVPRRSKRSLTNRRGSESAKPHHSKFTEMRAKVSFGTFLSVRRENTMS